MGRIEAGCTAVVVSSSVPDNNGLVVRVGECLGGPGYDNMHPSSGSVWAVDKDIAAMWVPSGKIEYNKYAAEINLRRIDDDDNRRVVSWDNIKDIYTPKVPA